MSSDKILLTQMQLCKLCFIPQILPQSILIKALALKLQLCKGSLISYWYWWRNVPFHTLDTWWQM